MVRFCASKTGLNPSTPSPTPTPPPSFYTARSNVVPLLQFFVRLWFHVWRLCCPYLFLISPSHASFEAFGGLCFVHYENTPIQIY